MSDRADQKNGTDSAQYLWQDGSAESSFTVTHPGTYHVTIALDGRSRTDSIHVYPKDYTLPLGNDTSLCGGQKTLLQSNAPISDYLWQHGGLASSYDVDKAGTYWLRVSDNKCQSFPEPVLLHLPLLAFCQIKKR